MVNFMLILSTNFIFILLKIWRNYVKKIRVIFLIEKNKIKWV